MLEEVLAYINNWFERERICNDFAIVGGEFSNDIPLLQDGQYFRIDGSVFNDGLHQWPSTDLTDEEFTGTVTALAVPKAVVDLAEEIADWQESNGSTVDSPYQSESFNNYSYTLRTAQTDGDGSSGAVSWRDVYRHRLNRWRKL